MIDYKIIFGFAAAIIGFIGLVPYIRDVFRGKTKPHAFSWFVWGLLESIAFLAQLSKGGGFGALFTALTAAVTFFIAWLAILQKDQQITLFDFIAFVGAIIGILLWVITKNPLLAVIAVAVADALGFLPTFRKAYVKPHEETLIEFALSALKWIVAIPALGALNITTWLYPASLFVTNSTFVVMVLIRKSILRVHKVY